MPSVLVQKKQRKGNRAIGGIPETTEVPWRVVGQSEAREAAGGAGSIPFTCARKLQ